MGDFFHGESTKPMEIWKCSSALVASDWLVLPCWNHQAPVERVAFPCSKPVTEKTAQAVKALG